VIKCLKKFLNGNFDIVLTVHKSKNNPYFNMLEKNKKGKFRVPKKIGKQNIFTRQKSPKVYSMNTVAYVAKTSFILRKRSILEGKIGIQEIQDKFCLDIDTKHDVEIMQLLQ